MSPLTFPATCSDDVVDLIQKLMQRDPIKRLGAGNADSKEIKAHPFFDGTEWESFQNKRGDLEIAKYLPKKDFKINPVDEKKFLSGLKEM